MQDWCIFFGYNFFSILNLKILKPILNTKSSKTIQFKNIFYELQIPRFLYTTRLFWLLEFNGIVVKPVRQGRTYGGV